MPIGGSSTMSDDFLQAAEDWLKDEELFRQSLERTARDYGFAAELIEKDVFSSLVLAVLATNTPESVLFKGGTCLSKVYMDFYRLSEDLDFSITVPLESSRAERRRLMKPVQALCERLPEYCPQLSVVDPMSGANQSRQYIQTLGYRSSITGGTARIKLEFGLREPILITPRLKPAGTLLVNPLTGQLVFPSFSIRVMALDELWAEKIRAALCRREPALRDFFDLDNRLDPTEQSFIALVGRKLAVHGTGPVNLSDKKFADLEQQKETDLKPLLRTREFEQFDLNRIWTALSALASRLKEF
jgi:predicted nucleotidyltransferase component of viral defense system